MFSSKISRFLVRNRRLVRNVSLASTVLVGQQSYYSSVCDATGPSHLARRVPLIDTVNIEIKASYGKRIRESLQWLKEKIDTIVALISRALYLILAFSPATLSSPLLLSNNAEFKKWWWSVLRDCVRKGGPCATKFAQWISTRPDLFPLSLCKNLEDLQSKVVKHCWQDTESAMILAFGDDWRKTIRFDGEGEGAVSTGSSFSPVVLGSGCVAQVLLGTIDDRKVAVKIIHPGVKAAIVADVTILRFLSWLVETVPGTENFSLVDCVEEFSSLMMLQLDMKLEADNLDRFRHNFKLSKETQTQTQPATSLFDSVLESISSIVQKSVSVIAVPKGKVTFPQPVWPYVTTSVLVETYEPGRQISDILDELTNKKLRREIATAGLDAILKMVFEDNFIHADLHPGNVIFREYGPDAPSSSSSSSSSLLRGESEGSSSAQWELSFIDAGLVATLNKSDRRNFIDLFAAVVKNDGRRVGELMIDRSRGGGVKCVNREGFIVAISELVNTVTKSGLSLGRIGIGALLQRVLVLCYLHKVKLEPKFVSVMIAMGVVEGLGKRLDPDVDVLLRAAPYVLKAALFE